MRAGCGQVIDVLVIVAEDHFSPDNGRLVSLIGRDLDQFPGPSLNPSEQFFLAAAAQNIKRLVRFVTQRTTPALAATT